MATRDCSSLHLCSTSSYFLFLPGQPKWTGVKYLLLWDLKPFTLLQWFLLNTWEFS